MAVYTDDVELAASLLPIGPASSLTFRGAEDAAAAAVADASFRRWQRLEPLSSDGTWRHFVVAGHAAESQYDRLIGMARAGAALPDGLVCIAGSGSGFQGFHGRSWIAARGNLHLSLHLAPGVAIERFESVFLALAAVSVVEAIEVMPGLAGTAGIKWVNDVLIAGAKVAGVLAHTQTRGARVNSVILGIGINVEVTPRVAPTAFVPRAGSLREFAPAPDAVTLPLVLRALLAALGRNYRLLLEVGYGPLVERYRERSLVLHQEVCVSSDDADEVPRPLAVGRVEAIGDGLELRLSGQPRPVTKGRLIVGGAPPPASLLEPLPVSEPPSP